ncbi:MAG: hypothetical protein AB7E73_15700 [Burkholderiales bacterium]
MSMPFLIFTCTACDYQGSSTVIWGRFDYDNQGQKLPIKRMLAWCESCDDLAPVEILPSVSRIQELRIAIEEKTAQVSRYREAAAQGRSLLGKLVGAQPRLPPEIQELDFQRSYAEDELREEHMRLEFLAGRESSAKCLLCGSDAWIDLPLGYRPSGTADKPGPPVRVGLRHPGCSGQLLVAHSGIRVSRRLDQKHYDRDGILLNWPPDEPSGIDSGASKAQEIDKNELIKELIQRRVRGDPVAKSMGFTARTIDSLSDLQLAGTPEATIVTIVETWVLLRRAGARDADIFSRIEDHRSHVFPRGQMPTPLNLITYIKYRLILEHSRGAPMPEVFVDSAIETAMQAYAA